MGPSRRAAVVAFAVAGLVLVAGVTYLASRLVSQPIGLASEPATLGKSLAPARPSTTPATTTRQATTTVTTTTTVPATTTTAPPTTTTTHPDDDSGRRHDEDDDD